MEEANSLELATPHYTTHDCVLGIVCLCVSVNKNVEKSLMLTIHVGTHDVQLVTVTYTSSSITIICQFAVGSPALGCSVHIINQTGSEAEVRTAMRDTNGQGLSLTVEVTVDELETAIYTVRVYDIESNGEANGAPAHTQMVNIAQPIPGYLYIYIHNSKRNVV